MSSAEAAAKTSSNTTVLVNVEYFTDPLCCWSWAMEPQWRRLRFEFAGQLRWRYRMGGMIPDWDSYDDPLNSIHRPSQMGPLWFQARELSGMPLEHRIWLEDPPRSSYPACAAVKAAQRQSAGAAEKYLRRLRQAAMVERQNIARSEVLLAIAAELHRDDPDSFDSQAFADDLNAPQSLADLREDLQLARYMGIGRYPTLILRRPQEQRGLCLTGYRPYASLVAALRQVDPRLEPLRQASNRQQYSDFWGGALEREFKELQAPM